MNRAMPQQDPGGAVPPADFIPPDPAVIGPHPGPIAAQLSPDVEVLQPMPPPSPPQMINIDDSPEAGPRVMGAHPGMIHYNHDFLRIMIYFIIIMNDFIRITKDILRNMNVFMTWISFPGVSIASDFMPLVNSTRSRLLELNVEYRDTMVQLKVGRVE